jgi:hypothetical protein
MSSLKIDEAVRRLPEAKYNKAEAMRLAGYTNQSAHAGTSYARLRKRIELAYNPEAIKADILKAEAKMLKDNDNSNLCRLIELRAKILGLTKEQSNTQVSVFTGDMLKELPPIDVTQNNDVSH